MKVFSVFVVFVWTLLHIYLTEGVFSGSLAAKGQFPYAVKILFYYFQVTHNTNKTNVTRYRCTGCILNKDYVLTSAGCFQSLITYNNKTDDAKMTLPLTKYSPTYIRGAVFDGWPSQEPGFQERQGSLLIVHPNFLNQSSMFDVDVALIKVQKPWNLTQDPMQINTGRLAQRIKDQDYLKCFVAGFGYTSTEEFVSDEGPLDIPEPIYGNILYYYKARVGRERYCKFLRQNFDGVNEKFDDFYACALPLNKTHRQGVCHGDIGGPMICNGLLTAIMSQTRSKVPCDANATENTAFAVFTSVGADEVISFIREYIPNILPLEEVPPGDPFDY